MPLKPWRCSRAIAVLNFLVTEGAIVLFFLYEDNYGRKYANKYNLQYVVRMIAFCAHLVNMGIAARVPQKPSKRRMASCLQRVAVSALVGCIVMMDPMMSIVEDAPETLAEHARGTFITAMVFNLLFCLMYPFFFIFKAGKYYKSAPLGPEEIQLIDQQGQE
ncbi:hypothetical protein J3B02_005049 [Coemansia erecta]